MKNILRTLPLFFAMTAALGCSSSDELEGGDGTNPDDKTPEEIAAQCSSPRTYKGFDGVDLATGRATALAGANRVRLKPYGLLYAEFERVLGKLPAEAATTFKDAADSFDVVRPRYYVEPKSTGVGMTAWFEVSFAMSEVYVKANAAKFAALPTAASARTVCEEMTNLAWQRRGSEAELGACVDFATTKLTAEKVPERAWSYVVATILSSADFLGY